MNKAAYYTRPRLFSDAIKERIFEVFTTLAGVVGGLVAGLSGAGLSSPQMLAQCAQTAAYYGLAAALVALATSMAFMSQNMVIKERNLLERLLSVVVSVLGGALFGLTLGGTYGYLMYLSGFYEVYGSFFPSTLLLRFEQINDPIIMGAIGGAVGNVVGTIADGVSSLVLELIQKPPAAVSLAAVDLAPAKPTATAPVKKAKKSE